MNNSSKAQQESINVSVNYSNTKNINDYLFGFNAPLIQGPSMNDPQFIEVIKDLYPSILRYPGGMVANQWDWVAGWTSSQDFKHLAVNRYKFEFFGHDAGGIKTKVIPWFRSLSHHYTISLDDFDCNTIITSNKSHLGDLLLEGCYWVGEGWPTQTSYTPSTGTHYLYEIENDFLRQFFEQYGIQNGPNFYDPETDYGDVTIYGGFQWFQYGFNNDHLNFDFDVKDLYATSLPALAYRPYEFLRSEYSTCSETRVTGPFTSFFQQAGSNNITNFPGKIVSDVSSVNAKELTVKDILGRDVTSDFQITNHKGNFIIKHLGTSPGIYYFIVNSSSTERRTIKFFIGQN